MSSFTGLKKLVTVPETLYRLYTSPIVNVFTLFPHLDYLEITAEKPLQDEVAADVTLPQILVSFLQLRKEASAPISTLGYRCTSEPSLLSDQKPSVDDLTSLDTFAGLNVVWDLKNIGTGQYLCGNGNPEELDFVDKTRRAERPRELPDT